MSQDSPTCPRCNGVPTEALIGHGPRCPVCGTLLAPETANPPSLPPRSRGSTLLFNVAFLMPGFLALVGGAISRWGMVEFAIGVWITALVLLPFTCGYCGWLLTSKRPMSLALRIVGTVGLAFSIGIVNLVIALAGCAILQPFRS